MASDDTITIDCAESHANGVFRELMTMKERRRWTDFLVNIEKTSLPCHRIIICANSRMIRELLDDEEMPAAAKDAINLDHINLATMEKVLDFMYSGKISFSGDKLKEYLEVAVNLKIETLTSQCLKHVPSQITPQNALAWLRLGFRRELTDLIEHTTKVIVQYFSEVAGQREFLTLDYPQVERCFRDALTADASAQVNRDDVLRSVFVWVNNENRVDHLEDLVNIVQPEKCSLDAVLNILQAQKAIICQCPNVLGHLTTALQSITAQCTCRQTGREDRQNNPDLMGEEDVDEKRDGADVEQAAARDEVPANGGAGAHTEGAVAQIEGAVLQDTSNVNQEDKTKGAVKKVSKSQDVKTKKKTQHKVPSNATRSKKLPVIIGGQVNFEASPNCWILDEESGQFVHLSNIPVDELGRWHSVCETDVGFAVTGGEDSDICVQYSMSTKSWSNLKKMLETRDSHGSFFKQGVIYVIGGIVLGSESKSVHCLDIACGDWQCILELPIALIDPKVADLNDNAYILNQETRQLIRMDVEKKTCVELSPLPGESNCIFGASMTTVNNKLCVAGDNICAMYEPDTDAWCEILKPNECHYYGSLIFYQEKLILLGGKWHYEEDVDGSDVIEEYNFEEGNWLASRIIMPQSLCRHYSFVLDIE